jgi:hypothetical protein
VRGVMACMDCTEDRRTQHGSQSGTSHPDHGACDCAVVLARLEQPTSSRWRDHSQVCDATEEYARDEDMVCLVVSAL